MNWKLKPGETSPVGPTHLKYLEYNKKAVKELLTQYGKVDIFWWDAAWWGGMFTAEMWDAENLTRMVRELQPHILQNNRASVPGDFDTPEQRLGSFQDWRLWETCTPLGKQWGNPYSPLKPFRQLIGMIINNVCNDGNIMFGFGPSGMARLPNLKRNVCMKLVTGSEKMGAPFTLPGAVHGRLITGEDLLIMAKRLICT